MNEGDLDEIIGLSDDEVEFEEDDESDSIWQERERKKREAIAIKISEIGFEKDVDILLNLVEGCDKVDEAYKGRIIFKPDEYKLFRNTLRDINMHLAESQTVLDSYISFSNSTPKFKNLLNLLYKFQTELTSQNSRHFNRIKLKKTGNYYFTVNEISDYVDSISFLLYRIIGTLYIAAEYIKDAEEETKRGGGGSSFDDYGRGGGGGYGRGDYFPASGMDSRGNLQMTKFNVPKQRDFGDSGDKV